MPKSSSTTAPFLQLAPNAHGIFRAAFRGMKIHAALLSTLAVLTTATSMAEFKPRFEQASRFLVWDYGYAQGQIDLEDDLTDLNKPCALVSSEAPDLSANGLSKLMRFPSAPEEVTSTANEIFKSLGLLNATKHSLKMNPIIATKKAGSKLTVFLFPELHLTSMKQGSLHNSIAFDMAMVTEVLTKRGNKIVNTSEGPQGSRLSIFDKNLIASKQRLDTADEYLAKRYVPAARLVDVVFGDKVVSQYHDSNDLLVRNMLLVKASDIRSTKNVETAKASWPEAKQSMLTQFPTRSSLVKLEDYKDFYEMAVSLPMETLSSQFTETCETRSHEMARYTYALAQKEKANVVYMSFGALHTYGVLEELKNYPVDVIVFSPNL